MIRNFLGLGSLFAVSTLGASALFAVACGGQNSGTSSSQLTPVTLGEISGTIEACKTGYAHPNVCCEGSSSQAASCGVYADSPFHACAAGTSTFPDPRSCCALDGSGACEAPPPPPPNPPPPSCGYACPPGQYQPPGQPGVCCFNDGSTIECGASGSGGVTGSSGGGVVGVNGTGSGSGKTTGGPIEYDAGIPSPPADAGEVDGGYGGGDASCSICSCPACIEGQPCDPCICPPEPCPPPPPPEDGGVGCGCAACEPGQPCAPCVCDDAGVPPPVCSCPVCAPGEACACDCEPPPPPPPVCNACPAGWQVPVGDPYLCCTEVGAVIECFSQGITPVSPPTPIGQPLPAQPIASPGTTTSK